jgi:hypothetical protein
MTADYAPGELRFSFSGREAEAGEVLTHLLPLARSVEYHLHVEYQTRGIEPGAGLRFHITGQPIDIESPSLSSEDWAVATVSFTAPEACVCRLALDYSRPPGHTRLEGVVRLRRIALEPAS